MSEKKLLVLGLLITQEMHGYQINELLQHGPAGLVQISKANAYRLLKTMEADGWVHHHDEQEGSRPTRSVYGITESGREAFLAMLCENLSSFPSPEFPAVVGLDFCHILGPGEAARLLKIRQDAVQERYDELDAIPPSARKNHLSLDYLHSFYAHELIWLEKTISGLRKG